MSRIIGNVESYLERIAIALEKLVAYVEKSDRR